MNNSGITSQFGFEFQKLAFLYFAMQLDPSSAISYESMDDVELEEGVSFCNIKPTRNLIQVKSGKLTLSIFEKIIYNWLLQITNSDSFICFSENAFVCPDDSFVDQLVNKINNSNARSDALVSQIKKLYSTERSDSDLKSDINYILQRTQFLYFDVESLIKESLGKFVNIYCNDTNSGIVQKERYEQLYIRIYMEINKAILNKEKFVLPYSKLFQIISPIRENISDSKYEISFYEFRPRSKSKIDEILNLQTESVKQLRLVFPDDNQAVIMGLTEQMFYEDLRRHFVSIDKEQQINELEFLARTNYDRTLREIVGLQEERTPYKTYSRTVNKNLPIPRLSDTSVNFSYYNEGCYIHLTDSGISDELKICWGDLPNETD